MDVYYIYINIRVTFCQQFISINTNICEKKTQFSPIIGTVGGLLEATSEVYLYLTSRLNQSDYKKV